VYLALKGDKQFAIKMVDYLLEKDKGDGDSEEKCFMLLKDTCPYMVKFYESFREVSIIIIYMYIYF
jgi:hypothetical protein